MFGAATIHGVIMAQALWFGGDRHAGNPRQTRSAVVARRGIVATSQPLAAQAGLEILRLGGNAVDAAIAANAVLGVVEPMSCGLGGDLFVIMWDAKSERLYGLNASGRAPKAASIELMTERGHKQIPTYGPLSWSVPGCVDGWDTLHKKFGRLELAQVLAPAIRYAAEGFPVSPLIGHDWGRSQPLLAETPEGSETFLKGGRAPRVGEMMTNKLLARTLGVIATEGPRAFYHGPIADKIVSYSQSHGGLFQASDFAEHSSTWVEPVSTSYRGHEVWELPPNGQGIAALQILNLLEPRDIRGMGHNSANFLHLFIEAKKLAYADRARYYADPQFEPTMPIQELISKPYAERQARRIDMAKAALTVPSGDPRLVAGDTVYLAAVDREHNCVSFIQSIYYGWGSRLPAADLGFMLQNRGTLFSLDPKHPNHLEGGKRPFHTIIPAMATKEGKPWLTFGVMGGDMQPQGHVQILVNMIDHGMDVQEAGDAARCRHFGSDEPTGGPAMADGGYVSVESGVSDEVIAELERRGHRVRRESGDFGGYQGIAIDLESGAMFGGSDPRKDGAAVGF